MMFKIRLENRFVNWDQTKTNCGLVEDCSDFPIKEPGPFDRTFWSHKVNGPALKYSVAQSIHNGNIVHWSGPYKPSEADVTIFRNDLMTKLPPDEPVEVDRGCGGENQLKTPDIAKSRSGRKQKSKVRSRQETIFAKVKAFECFQTAFRHSHEKHELCVGAVLVLLQIGFDLGTNRQYDIDYTNEYF